MAENRKFYGKAYLWNGRNRIPGQLSLQPDKLLFQLEEFENSHLSLEIRLADIMEIEEFLLYDISLNGLYVKSRFGKEEHFILEDPVAFRKAVHYWQRQNPDPLQA